MFCLTIYFCSNMYKNEIVGFLFSCIMSILLSLVINILKVLGVIKGLEIN
jgi:hypothetical protein